MSTEFFNDKWRMPANENQSKQSNYSFYGDGSGEINASSVPLSLESWTISVWLKPNITEQTKIIWNMEYPGAGGFKLIHQYGGSGSGTTAVYFQYYAPSFNEFSSQVTVTKDNWHHVIVRYNKGVDYRIYIDGILSGIKTGATVTYTWPATRDLQIFKAGGFNGSLNQFCVFNYALSDTSTTVGNTATGQVATLYNGTALANPMALSPKPVAYYKLGDQSASLGSLSNYLVPNNSLQGYVFEFNNSQYIDCGNNSTINQVGSVFTMSCWINTTSQARGSIMGTFNTTSYAGYFIELLANGTVFSGYYAGISNYVNRPSIAIVDDGVWHHVCCVMSGTGASSTVNIYIDKVLSNGALSLQGTPAGSNTTNSFQVNNQSFSAGARYSGETSNVQVFNTSLTAAEVTTLYNDGSPLQTLASIPQNASLQGWWKLNAEDVFIYPNWSVIDSAGSNNGTSFGMTSSNLVQSTLELGSGYSPYALELDGVSNYFTCGNELGNSLGNSVTNFTISGWYTAQSAASNEGLFGIVDSSGNNIFQVLQINYARVNVILGNTVPSVSFDYDSRNQWTNFIIVVSGNGSSPLTIKFYHDGTELSSSATGGTLPNVLNFTSTTSLIGVNGDPLDNYFNGGVSNFSFFNFSLTSAQVAELNNNQRTIDLNNLSFTKPLAWWELGSNSFFDPDSSEWTSLNNGTVAGGNALSTSNMTNNALTNGPGYSANGLGDSTLDILGNAPYSTSNGLSENMDVLDRVSGLGNVPG